MTSPWTPGPTSESVPVEQPAPAHGTSPAHETTPVATPAADAGAVLDELAVLDQLEADLSAVEQAVESLERVASEGLGGEAAATQIAAAVSVERFGEPPASD